ncbi:hypothetical protein [Nonomuraea salmonea]|uniref:hypothetical protein n=1 Tax=Nonomuraea salmonea TaxID=46181 RepID=UPI0031EC4FAF
MRTIVASLVPEAAESSVMVLLATVAGSSSMRRATVWAAGVNDGSTPRTVATSVSARRPFPLSSTP